MNSEGKESWHCAFIYSGGKDAHSSTAESKWDKRGKRNRSSEFGSCREKQRAAQLLKMFQAFDIDTGIRKQAHL